MSTGFYHPNSSDPMVVDVQDSQDYSLLSKDWAIKMDGPVEGSSYSSQWNATLSATKAGEAAGSADDALGYAETAQNWAEYDYGVTVPGASGYSAKHWALYAEQAAAQLALINTFVGLADTPSDYLTNAGKVLAVNETEDGLAFAEAGGSLSAGVVTYSGTGELALDGSNADTHLDKYVRLTGSGASISITNGNSWTVGGEVHVANRTGGDVTFNFWGDPGPDVYGLGFYYVGGSVTIPDGGVITAKCVAADVWDIFGDVVAA